MRATQRVPVWLILVCLMAVLPNTASGQSIETLLMPGPVIQGHAKVENECRKCHEPFSKVAQSKLCLACHKSVATDIRTSQGHHGRIKGISRTECKRCHTEHKGRQADVVGLDKDTFDHRATDFALTGAHAKVDCVQCHKPKKPYRNAPSRCFDCHKKNDAHGGRLGKKCQSCHTPARWSKSGFDHDKKTRFPLVGKHRRATCASCHPGNRFKRTPLDCNSCHKLNDVHAGRFGTKCNTCHAPQDWKRITFDHDRKTKFPLRGKHAKARCASCHKDGFSKKKEKLATTCYGCHRQDDVHKSQQGKACQRCHNERGWRTEVFFDHDLTRFPLIGQHVVATCADCHSTASFKSTSIICGSCHATDDRHKRRLGPQCGLCHNPNGWKFWKFDHDRQTDFRLDGAHRKLLCERCHRTPVSSRISMTRDCAGCHQGDDIHRGRFGRRCDRCHNTKTFNNPTVH